MKVEVYLSQIHRKYHHVDSVYDTEKEIEARIEIRLRLPKAIKWSAVTKLSVIIGTIKELVRAQCGSKFILNMMLIVQQHQEEIKHGMIKRSYGKLEPLKQKKPEATS